MYMGANKLETVKVLLDAGASLDYRTFSGGNVLTGAVETKIQILMLFESFLRNSSHHAVRKSFLRS